MPEITNRDTPRPEGGSAEHRLARLLDTPLPAHVVALLPPQMLHQLVRHRGLEACGELIASATPAQLTSLLDLDLWRHAQPGRDDQFDVDRFGEWLEVLVDTGDSVAARTVASLDRGVVVAGLSRYVRVFDPGIFEPTAQSDDEPVRRQEAMREGDSMDPGGAVEPGRAGRLPTLGSPGEPLECELGGYIVRARRTDRWEAVVTLLAALDAEHTACFHAVMQGCRRLSSSRPEADGLDNLLPTAEQHLHDVAIERERRRSQQGFATPADARAFLQMARQPTHWRSDASVTGPATLNPIVAAYFRAADESPDSSDETARSPERTLESPPPPTSGSVAASRSSDAIAHAADVPESLEAVVEFLAEAGMMPAWPRALLAAPDDPQAARLSRLRRLMAYVRDADGAAHLTRIRELAFLANVLVSGCSVQSRSFTPQEASDAAAAICNLGLEVWPVGWPGATSPGAPSPRPYDTASAADTSPPEPFLVDRDLVTAFEVGWSVLYRDVSLWAADQLIGMLAPVGRFDRDARPGLVALRRTLVKQRKAGTPWRARGAAEVLAMLDTTAWVGVLGLLDECPVVPEALLAVVEGRTTTVSPTEFDFISTAAQLGDVRMFLRKLPDALSP